MRQINVQNYLVIGQMLQFVSDFSTRFKAGAELRDEGLSLVRERMAEIRVQLEKLDLKQSCALTDHAIGVFDGAKTISVERVVEVTKCLLVTVRSEMANVFAGYVPAERARFWGLERPFGADVYENFESARRDSTSAGNCYAVEQYDACVFHLMRVIEKALRALAKERGIKIIGNSPVEWNDWGRILSALEKEANAVNGWPKGARKDRALEFYRGAIGEMYAFKDAYRNYVMHDRSDYDVFQAGSAYQRVCEFMQRLAKHLSENQKGSIKWPRK